MIKRPTLLQSFLPILILVGLIALNILYAAEDTLGGANQLALTVASAVAVVIALYNRHSWDSLLGGAIKTLTGALSPILILFMIGILAGTWMLSGVIPAMIYYGLYVLQPEYFLPATVIITAVVSVTTGSSWSTVATIGIALLGVGQALGFSEAMIAGAIISGAYFGDKISPMSDTTNLASATVGVPLFTHIRYMMLTTVPTVLLTLVIFTVLSLFGDTAHPVSSAAQVQHAIADLYHITPLLFVVPAFVIYMIIKRMPPVPVLFLGGLFGGVLALIFQPQMIASLSGEESLSVVGAYEVITRAMYGVVEMNTGSELLDTLFSTRGMVGMLNTVWLIITAMVFGGIMEAAGFISRITEALIARVNSDGALVTTTAATCILFNGTTSDQYISIVIPGKMYASAYERRNLAPEVLSRTLEDSATATSVLIPWNTCGATQAGVLGVATLTYLPFAFFCYLSPLMTIFMAWINYKIRRNSTPTTAPNMQSQQ